VCGVSTGQQGSWLSPCENPPVVCAFVNPPQTKPKTNHRKPQPFFPALSCPTFCPHLNVDLRPLISASSLLPICNLQCLQHGSFLHPSFPVFFFTITEQGFEPNALFRPISLPPAGTSNLFFASSFSPSILSSGLSTQGARPFYVFFSSPPHIGSVEPNSHCTLAIVAAWPTQQGFFFPQVCPGLLLSSFFTSGFSPLALAHRSLVSIRQSGNPFFFKPGSTPPVEEYNLPFISYVASKICPGVQFCPQSLRTLLLMWL